MPRLLHPVILPDDPDGLGEPELRSGVLDGDLARVGDAFAPIDLPIGPVERAAAIAPIVPRGLAVAELAAAWVWGAAATAGSPAILYARPRGTRPPSELPGAHVREVLLRADDLVVLGSTRVTSPLRTAVDLARLPPDAFDEFALQRLAREHGFGRTALLAAIAARPRLPGRRIAAARSQVLLTR